MGGADMAMIKRVRIATVPIALLLLILLFGCDISITSVSFEIEGIPNRIIYIANVDTEIDLSGLKFIDTLRDGTIIESPLENWASPSQEPGRLVYHDIDFTKPGVYEVEIYREWRYLGGWRGRDMVLSYKYFIQVVDQEAYEALNQSS